MLDVFESWDLNAPPLPRRSLLLPLDPIGIGTPFVESLTSYIARLAEVHAAKVSDLVGYVLAACAPRDAPIVSDRARSYRMGSGFSPGTHAINGLAEDARRWIAAVETATDRSGLRLLTLMPLKQVFCKQSLFREIQAWCPGCFSDWQRDGLPLYLPLLWHLRMVSICAKHQRPLDESCPHCEQHFGPLYARAKPGYCSRCRGWLGRSASSRPEQAEVQSDGSQRWMATCVGDLLASMPRLDEPNLREILRENIGALVRDVAAGNQRAFCSLTGSPGTAVGGWLSGQKLPRPDLLFQVCSRLHVPVSEMLRRDPTLEIPNEITARGIAAGTRGAWRDDPNRMRAVLQAALDENPPPSLNDLALRLKYHTCAPLRRLDPANCKMIALRYRVYRRRWHETWTVGDMKCTPQEIEVILMESLARERPTPISQIAAALGYESSCRLRHHFPKLCEAIARKQAQNREAQRERFRTALITAISEEPPPATESLEQRLGCCSGRLKYYFPDLCRRLLDARKVWEAKEWDAIRKRTEVLAAEMKGASVPDICRAAGIKQMFLYLHFPVLYRQIVSRYLECRDALRLRRRAALGNDVRAAVIKLSHQGLRASVNNVLPLLGDEAARDWRLIRQAIERSTRELGVD